MDSPKKWRQKRMNVNFEYARTLAAEGAILLLLGLIPYVGWILGIIGVVLFLRGMRELSNYYQDERLYQNSWTGVKFYIVALLGSRCSYRCNGYRSLDRDGLHIHS